METELEYNSAGEEAVNEEYDDNEDNQDTGEEVKYDPFEENQESGDDDDGKGQSWDDVITIDDNSTEETPQVEKAVKEPATKPAAKPATKPAAKPATKSAAKPAAKPAPKATPKASPKPAAKSVAKGANTPAAKESPKPVAKPVAASSSKPAAKPSNGSDKKTNAPTEAKPRLSGAARKRAARERYLESLAADSFVKPAPPKEAVGNKAKGRNAAKPEPAAGRSTKRSTSTQEGSANRRSNQPRQPANAPRKRSQPQSWPVSAKIPRLDEIDLSGIAFDNFQNNMPNFFNMSGMNDYSQLQPQLQQSNEFIPDQDLIFYIVDDSSPDGKIFGEKQQMLKDAWSKLLAQAILDSNDSSPPVRIQRSGFVRGIYTITLANRECIGTLYDLVDSLPQPWKGAKMRLVGNNDNSHRAGPIELTKAHLFLRTTSAAPRTSEEILKILIVQNPDLKVNLWKIFKNEDVKGGQFLVMGIDYESYERLQQGNGTAFFLEGNVNVKLTHKPIGNGPPPRRRGSSNSRSRPSGTSSRARDTDQRSSNKSNGNANKESRSDSNRARTSDPSSGSRGRNSDRGNSNPSSSNRSRNPIQSDRGHSNSSGANRSGNSLQSGRGISYPSGSSRSGNSSRANLNLSGSNRGGNSMPFDSNRGISNSIWSNSLPIDNNRDNIIQPNSNRGNWQPLSANTGFSDQLDNNNSYQSASGGLNMNQFGNNEGSSYQSSGTGYGDNSYQSTGSGFGGSSYQSTGNGFGGNSFQATGSAFGGSSSYQGTGSGFGGSSYQSTGTGYGSNFHQSDLKSDANRGYSSQFDTSPSRPSGANIGHLGSSGINRSSNWLQSAPTNNGSSLSASDISRSIAMQSSANRGNADTSRQPSGIDWVRILGRLSNQSSDITPDNLPTASGGRSEFSSRSAAYPSSVSRGWADSSARRAVDSLPSRYNY